MKRNEERSAAHGGGAERFVALPVFALLAACDLVAAEGAKLLVDTDFAGGSAVVEHLDQANRVLEISPEDFDDRDRGWRCWWYAKVGGLRGGDTLTLRVGKAPWATPERAAFSYDGKQWQQSEAGTRQGGLMQYKIPYPDPPPESGAMWVAWGPPFVPKDAERLVRQTADASPCAKAFVLCKTREGRSTPALRITAPKREGRDHQRDVVWIQARQHAWESGSSWVARGVIEWLVSDAPDATKLREHAEIIVVPIMDIDNAQHGAGGKGQKPQDHNRDWSAKPHWNAVAAAQKAISAADEEGRFRLFVDLHNPGAGDKFPYFYVPPVEDLGEASRVNQARFLDAVKKHMTAPMRFMGKTIASGASYDPKAWRQISKIWVNDNTSDGVVAVTLETPWNTPSSTQEGYQGVGRQLAKAISAFLRD